MGFGRLLSRRSKEPPSGYTSSISSDFSIPESVPPAYPVDGRLNKDAVAVDAKSYMPAFPIMASSHSGGAEGGPKPRFAGVLSRKPVGRQPEQQHTAAARPYQTAQAGTIPRPPFSPGGGGGNDGHRSFYSHQDDVGRGQQAAPPNIRPMSIPVPGMATSNSNTITKQRHTSTSFLSSLTNTNTNTTPTSTSNGNSSPSGSRPHVDVPPSEVRRCTKLLRRMYELQLDMWSMRYAYEQDLPERHEKRRQADALLVEIQNMIQTWTATSGAGWTPEERAQVEYIGRHLDSLSQNKFW